MSDLNERDTVITQYLHEAYAKERELERALEAHVSETERPAYKKRLRQHLTETRHHAKAVQKRLKQLGAEDSILAEGAHLIEAAVGAGKAVAKAPMEMIGSTNAQEQMLSNARSEFKSENEEIALYTTIEALAEKVGDKETAKLARSILREEERMAKFISGQLPALANAVATERVPAAQRRSPSRTRTAGRTASSTSSHSRQNGAGRSRAGTAKRKSAPRATANAR